eukprot:gene4418-3217_t
MKGISLPDLSLSPFSIRISSINRFCDNIKRTTTTRREENSTTKKIAQVCISTTTNIFTTEKVIVFLHHLFSFCYVFFPSLSLFFDR